MTMTPTATPAGVPTTMRAGVLRDFDDLAVEEVPTPDLGPGEVLIRVRACGLCGTDLKLVSGGFAGRWPPSLPFIIGHEWSGEVVALGDGVDDGRLAVGDRVVAENHIGCGRCPNCRAGRYNLCELAGTPGYKLYGHTAQGALAEYAVREAVMVHKIPDSVSFETAALINQGALTVHAFRRMGFQAGGTVAIFGPGLLGLLSAAVARASGASQIVMVGRGERLELAGRMGCDAVVDYEREDPVEGVRALTGGLGATYVLDCTGNPAVPGQALGVVRRGGKLALLGLTGGKMAEIPEDRLVLDEIDLLGIRSSPNAYPAMIALLGTGAIDLAPLVDDRYPLDRVSEAFAALEQRTAIRPIITL